MITCVIKVIEVESGIIGTHMNADNHNGSPLERAVAGMIDAGIRESLLFIMEQLKTGELIEGQNVAAHARSALERIKTNLKK